MAQVGLDSHSLIVDPSPSSAPSQDLSATGEVLPIVSSVQSRRDFTEQEKTLVETGTEMSLGENVDDEVLFVFSAPRRRKKKRRRLESPGSLPATKAYTAPLAGLSVSIETPTLNTSVRRGTTGMVQSLESCHIESDDKPVPTRGYSLPTAQLPALQQHPMLQFPAFDPTTEPNFAAMHDLPITESCSMQWWNDPLPTPLLTDNLHTDWMNVETEAPASNKRKRDVNSDETSYQLDFLDAQISPRTEPATTMLLPRNSFEDDTRRNFDTVGRVKPRAGLQLPTHSSTMPSWSANWNAFGHDGQATQHSRYPYSSAIPLSITRNNYTSPYQQIPHHLKATFGQSSKYFQRPQEIAHNTPIRRTNQMYAQFGKAALNSVTNQRGFGVITPEGPPPHGTSPTYQRQKPPTISTNIQPSAQASAPLNIQASTSQLVVHNTMSRAPKPVNPRNDNPNDVLRKPSLYKIPPWPLPSMQSPTQTSQCTVLANAPIQRSMTTFSRHDQIGSTSNPMRPSSHVAQVGHPRIDTQSQTTQPLQHTTNSSNEQPSSRRGARKHSPNLIVDIAETCQELFPFAAVAERHSVPLQKVFDTFSAIIQLPLLRNADDKRRHGSLGKKRQKEFRDAKKAMEKAQADEMRRKRVGGEMGFGGGERNAQGKGKEKERERGLLKHAILNNVRETRGGV